MFSFYHNSDSLLRHNFYSGYQRTQFISFIKPKLHSVGMSQFKYYIHIFILYFQKSSRSHIYLYMSNINRHKVLSSIQESTYIFVTTNYFPKLSSSKVYYLMVVIRTRIITIYTNVFIFSNKVPHNKYQVGSLLNNY